MRNRGLKNGYCIAIVTKTMMQSLSISYNNESLCAIKKECH